MPIRRLATRLRPSRAALLGQMLRFGAVGTLGFLIDTGVLYLALWLGAGLYLGRVLSYLTAASVNWAINRAWTFPDAAQAARGQQWAMFLVVNLCGFAINYGIYSAMVSSWALAAAHPALGVAAGSLAGMGGNFLLSRRFVFQPARSD